MNFEYLSARYEKFIQKWAVDDPHPRLKRKLGGQHISKALPPEELCGCCEGAHPNT